MRAHTEALRARWPTWPPRRCDAAHRHPDAAARKQHQAFVRLHGAAGQGLVAPRWASKSPRLGVQVHGGMGFVEETGACQHLRDSRITTIYEGTTGIQAADLAGRKLSMDRGAAMRALIADIAATTEELGQAAGDDIATIRAALREGVGALAEATEWMLGTHDAEAAMAVSVDYMMLAGTVCGGWQMARAARVAQQKLMGGEDPVFHEAKLVTARFYAEHVLPKAGALCDSVKQRRHFDHGVDRRTVLGRFPEKAIPNRAGSPRL
ncbi:MAG: acyl-CoA dehydrogenase [Comamonadaceae bacterium]|nr:acyl-CoA dehydrogenase [Comamonadaceae bacterium]